MRRRLKAFLVCLLLVALPVQVIGAVAMSKCGIAHRSAESRHTMEDATPDGDHIDMATIEGGKRATDDEGCHNVDSRQRCDCDTCAGCCFASYAAPPFNSLAIAPERAYVSRPGFITSFAGPFPDRLDRPPRATS